MSARIVPILAAVAAFLWGSGAARADDASAQKEIQAIYTQIADGVKKLDPKPAAAFVADNFRERDLFGQMHNLAEVRERYQMAREKTQSVDEAKATVHRVVTRDNMALAFVRIDVSARVKDKDDKPHRFESRGYTLDVWEKTADGWKVRFVDQVAIRHMLDGKPLTVPIKPKGDKKTGAPARRAEAEPAWIPVAQWFYTPYNYGWPGVGYGYTGYMGINPYNYASAYSNTVGNYMMANRGSQKAIYQQQREYEAYQKERKRQEKALAEQQKQMQQYLSQYQQNGGQPPDGGTGQ
jgi:hypothetical protein